MTQITVDKLRLKEYGKGGYGLLFNLHVGVYDTDGDFDLISVGWRLYRGYITAPNFRAGSTWTATIYGNEYLCRLIYDAVKAIDLAEYKGVESLLEFYDATESFRIFREVLSRFTPSLKERT